MSKKLFIKHHVKNLLKNSGIDIKRVEVNRPNPVSLTETPIVLIYSGPEDLDVWEGSEFIPDVHIKDFSLNIDIVINGNTGDDDYIDEVYEQIENVILGDIFLKKEFNKDGEEQAENDNKFIHGLKYKGTKPYTISDDSNRLYWATSGLWIYRYDEDAIPDNNWEKNSDYNYTRTDVNINTQPDEDDNTETLIQARAEHNKPQTEE